MMNAALAGYLAIIDTMFGRAEIFIKSLTGILLAIDLAVWGIKIAMGEDNDVSAIGKKMFTVAATVFFVWNLYPLGRAFLNGMIDAAAYLSGLGSDLANFNNPGAVLHFGLETASQLLGVINEVGLIEGYMIRGELIAAYVLLIIAFALLAIQMALTMVEFWFTILLGSLLAPFMLWKPTQFIGQKVPGAVVGNAVKAGAVQLTVSLGLNVFAHYRDNVFSEYTTARTAFRDAWSDAGSGGGRLRSGLRAMWEQLSNDVANPSGGGIVGAMAADYAELRAGAVGMVVTAALLVLLAIEVPKMAASLLSGMPQLSALNTANDINNLTDKNTGLGKHVFGENGLAKNPGKAAMAAISAATGIPVKALQDIMAGVKAAGGGGPNKDQRDAGLNNTGRDRTAHVSDAAKASGLSNTPNVGGESGDSPSRSSGGGEQDVSGTASAMLRGDKV